MDARNLAKRAVRAASSMKAGIVLISLSAAVLVLGSASPALSGAIFGSKAFALLLVLLALNTGLCAASRRPGLAGALRETATAAQRLRSASVFALHLSILIVAAAGVWASLSFTSTSVEAAQGESFSAEGESLNLESIRIERYPDGSVSDWVSSLGLRGGITEVRVNHPLRIGATKVVQTGYGRRYSLSFAVLGKAGARELELDEGAFLPLVKDGSVGIRIESEGGDTAGGATLDVVADGRIAQRVRISAGQRYALGDSGVALTVAGSRPYSVFTLRRTPGIGFLWLGFALLALSAGGLLIAPARRGANDGKGETE
jgi:ResB protein required for cytochrome c biosynthesis